MLKLIDLVKFKVIAAPELGVACTEFGSVRFHEADNIVLAAHIDANKKCHGLKLGLITLQSLFGKSFGLSGNDEVGKGFLDGCTHY